MSAPLCTVCLDTGEVRGEGFLDCTSCDVAEQRAELDAWAEKNCADKIPSWDLWLIYKHGIAAAAPVVPVAAQPVATVRQTPHDEFKDLLLAIVDVYYDGVENPPGEGCYVSGALPEIMAEARAALSEAPQSTASVTDVAKDAARYKFLCRAAFDASMAQAEIDKEVDAAIAAQQGEKTK